jgi:hypothetical protein
VTSWAGLTREILTPVLYVAAAFLVTSGGGKLWDPSPASMALAEARLPASHVLVRILGTVEVGIGVLCLVRPSAYVNGSLAGMYLAFAGFLGYLLRENPQASSCGCAGKRQVRPNPVHAVLDLVVVAVAAAAAFLQTDSLERFTAALGPVRGAVFVVGCCVLAYLIYAVVILSPEAFSAYERPSRTHRHETPRDRALRAEEELRAAGIYPGHPSLYPGTNSDVGVRA